MKKMKLTMLLFASFAFRRTVGYGNGAQDFSCGDMRPFHSEQPKVSLPPYILTASTNTYKLGDVINSKCSVLKSIEIRFRVILTQLFVNVLGFRVPDKFDSPQAV